jgi:hypothetical protein
MEVFMRSSLKTASYLVLSLILWPKIEVKATGQDLMSAMPKHLSAKFSEERENAFPLIESEVATIIGKRKREDNLENIDQPDLKRAKLYKQVPTQYVALPNDILNVIANFIEDPITFQKFKVVSKSWNQSASKEHYLIPSNT